MRIANLASGVILVLLATCTLVFVIPTQIDEGPAGMMSPRLLPQMMMALILGLSALLIAANWRDRRGDEPAPFTRAELLASAMIGGVFALSLFLFLALGPLPAAIVLIVGALRVLGERRLVILIGMPLVLIGGTYLLFYRVLGTAIM